MAEQIRLELTPEQETALTSSRRVKPFAVDAYLRGLKLIGPRVLAGAWAPQALEQFEQALALDPPWS